MLLLMKKILGIIVLGLLWSNVVVAKPIYLNCRHTELYSHKLWMHEYFSLDFANKKYTWESKALVKHEDDISNGEELHKETIELPFMDEDSQYLTFGVIFFNNGKRHYDIFKLNKENFDLSREDNLFAGMESSMNYTCNQIDELPSYSWSFRKFWNDLGLFK